MARILVEKLRRKYERRKNDVDIIRYEGLEFVPGYLKYLLEYLEMNKRDVVELIPQEKHYAG